MKLHEFDVFLKGLEEVTEEQIDALFTAGCDDGTPVSRDGQTWVHFDRYADSLEEAIRSAIAQVQAAGLVVSKIELDADSAIFRHEQLQRH